MKRKLSKKQEEPYLLSDGEWFEIADIHNFNHICCDCGLTHTFEFEFQHEVVDQDVKEPRLFFKAVRNLEETEAIRSKETIKITKGNK